MSGLRLSFKLIIPAIEYSHRRDKKKKAKPGDGNRKNADVYNKKNAKDDLQIVPHFEKLNKKQTVQKQQNTIAE